MATLGETLSTTGWGGVRSINIPLISFYNVDATNKGPITGSSAGTQPIFNISVEGMVTLRWTSGDTDPAGTTIIIPQDYASGGTFHAVAKGAGTQDNDLECKVDVQVPGGAASATMEAAAEGGNFDAAAGSNLVAVTFTPANADEFADGAAVNVSIARTGGTDTVDLYGFEFRYTTSY